MSRKQLAGELTGLLGYQPSLERFYPGRGWGLKYLLYKPGEQVPVAVLKVASMIIERRLRTRLGETYMAPAGRFERESGILARLAAIGLGPGVLACLEDYFVRDYIAGQTLAGMSAAQIARRLPSVLDAVDRACAAGIFHTDLNAGNVIVEPTGGIKFIDCEIPRDPPDEANDIAGARAYCHQRLLYSLAGATGCDTVISDTAGEYFSAAENPPISPEQASALVLGKTELGENQR
ncbi:MAG: hypothetical protein FVQ81_16845 [Candidatus Glassbacteria bacterium]|nr:hypothetical protein [Candidatus Glassbacteria bacterium]